MKAAVSAVLAGVGLMGLVALAPTSASALPVATTGVQAQSEAMTQVRWHRHWHHRRVFVMRHHGWHRGPHWGWGHRHHHHW